MAGGFSLNQLNGVWVNGHTEPSGPAQGYTIKQLAGVWIQGDVAAPVGGNPGGLTFNQVKGIWVQGRPTDVVPVDQSNIPPDNFAGSGTGGSQEAAGGLGRPPTIREKLVAAQHEELRAKTRAFIMQEEAELLAILLGKEEDL